METTNAVGRRPDVSPKSGKAGIDTDALGIRFDLNGAPDHADRVTVGWSVCSCPAPIYRPGIVLDPFGGSGTTGEVASGMGRTSILVDIDERNLDLARERIGMFLTTDHPFAPAPSPPVWQGSLTGTADTPTAAVSVSTSPDLPEGDE